MCTMIDNSEVEVGSSNQVTICGMADSISTGTGTGVNIMQSPSACKCLIIYISQPLKGACHFNLIAFTSHILYAKVNKLLTYTNL
mmetsp:Transcript_16918/g.20327  ORF Transcript_16918/g.20327 Transcript_16918/m.20327 type:complete len:85 (+) Transcript_16918:662-916(+)